MAEAETVGLDDSAAKRDIMSLIVRARYAERQAMEQGEKAPQEGGRESYTMSDQAMMDQVLTFLGAGHETTASGLAWVCITL